MTALENRIELAARLGQYMLSDDEDWQAAKDRAVHANSWFTTEYVALAVQNICSAFLQQELLRNWAAQYPTLQTAKTAGIVMAGNIPLVGFHDFLCGFVSGNKMKLKLSSKDEVLLKHLIAKLYQWDESLKETIVVSDMLKDCDAYIATGSNNTARYFEQYFGKYPNIIRKNRTSVALLTGNETEAELDLLAKDVFTYFGLGCRNVTQVCVPQNYDFEKLLTVLRKYSDMIAHHKYKNNYDYYLAIYLLNKVHYLTNESLLMVENEIPFSSVAVLHYRYYNNKETLVNQLQESDEIQCIVGQGFTGFGQSQTPTLSDYPDGVDTMAFLCGL